MTTSVGPDGIDVTGYGWTTQSTQFHSNESLESYPGPSSSLLAASLRQGYSAWSFDPIFASTSAGVSVATTTWAVLIYVPENFTNANIDWLGVSGTPNVTLGLWPATAPAGTATPLAYSNANAQTAGQINTVAWSSSVNLVGGTSYMVTLYGSTTGTVGCQTPQTTATDTNAWIVNAAAGSLYSATTTYRAAEVGTLDGTLSSSSTFGTSTLYQNVIWIGLH